MRRGPKALLWAVVIVMASITLIQWIAAFGNKGESPADAKRMLYEASLFQVELLSGHAAEAARATLTGDLDGLKQAAYSVEFTHERLAKAYGPSMPKLKSASALLEMIVRLQIGGERRLAQEEAERLSQAAGYAAELYDAYARLYGDGGGAVDAAAAERVKAADEAISAIVEGWSGKR